MIIRIGEFIGARMGQVPIPLEGVFMPVRKAIKRNGNAEKENTHREGAPRMSLKFRKGEVANFLNFDERTEQNF